MSLIAAMMLGQAIVRVGPPDAVLPPSDPATAFSVFRTICAAPFPDPAGFARAITVVGGFTRWRPASALEQLVAGETWQSPTLTIRYFPDDGKPTGQPSPQCHVKAVALQGSSPEVLFAQFAAANGLGAGKIVGKASFRTEMWDLDGGGGVRWRVIFGTERKDGQLELKLAMLNLGTKR